MKQKSKNNFNFFFRKSLVPQDAGDNVLKTKTTKTTKYQTDLKERLVTYLMLSEIVNEREEQSDVHTNGNQIEITQKHVPHEKWRMLQY